AFGFDMRVRLVMREQATEAPYENPWNSDFVCDALGNACRELWAEGDLWRPIMVRTVRALTAPLTALHRELNAFLQDRDILPVLRVRTRSSSGGRKEPEQDGSALLGRLIEQFEAKAAAQPAKPAPAADDAPAADLANASPLDFGGASPLDFGGASPLDFGNAPAWRPPAQAAPPNARGPQPAQPWSALIEAVNLLQRGQPAAAAAPAPGAFGAAPPRDAAAPKIVPALKESLAGHAGSMHDRVLIEVVSALLDEVFDDRYLPAEIKTVFGRLQIAILKATLLDPSVLANPRHPVRQFFETLAAASVGLRSDDEYDVLFIELADHLATLIRDHFADDLTVFDTASGELDTFLDAERAAYNKKLAEALPLLLAQDEYTNAEREARAALAAHLGQRHVPPEVRAFLDHECVERLASAYVDNGAASESWSRQLQLVDDLLWSLAPEAGVAARKRFTQVVPQLVRNISSGWGFDAAAQARRGALLTRLYAIHTNAMKAAPEAVPDGSGAATIDAAAPVFDADAARSRGNDEDERVAALIRGDWCSFRAEAGGAPMLAKFAWRAPYDTCLLFTYRNGSTAVVHTPQSLSDAFASGWATVAVEAVPLFERAMARLMEDRVAGGAGVADE
ncbi:MAG: DUF1631 family protein, partial [Casimicrobiaceae bacterium]